MNHATKEGVDVGDQSLLVSDQFVVGDLVVTQKSNLRRGKWILGEYNPNIAPHGVVVDVRTKRLEVDWLAQRHWGALHPHAYYGIPNVIYPDERPVVAFSNVADATCFQIGDRIRFLSRDVETELYGGRRMDRRELSGFDGNVWRVIGTKTIVDVEWQDGTMSTDLLAKDLRVHLHADEYDGWPVLLSEFRTNT